MDTVYFFTLGVFLLFMLTTPVAGCSDFLLKTDSPGNVISGRTIDWFEKEGVKGILHGRDPGPAVEVPLHQ